MPWTEGANLHRGAMFNASFFNGGPGRDFADVCGDIGAGVTLKKVESTSNDCPLD